MSWIHKLYETYNNCQSMIGIETSDNEVPLLPICHTTQKAQIEITLDGNGRFKRARIVPKEESRTIIPCTESSGGRTSGESGHPLCDKLQYIAKDYKKYGGDKDSYYESYFKQLSDWTGSGKNKKVQFICEYVKRGNVVSDLIENGVLIADKNKKLLKQRLGEKDKKGGLDIFDLLPGRIDPKTKKIGSWQADAFVRWQVEIPNDPQSSVWNDQEILRSWINYYSSTKKTKALCYVTGEESFSADQHPAKLRNDGDKAKIISSNDLSGFTFRGRFIKAEQAASVGFETTQKAHFALRWLISRQGFRKGDLAIVAWATSGASVPELMGNALSILGAGDLPSDETPRALTAQEVAIKLKKKIAGYGKEIGNTTDIVVMGLDSATPGRLAITYYRELTGSDFLERINDWHESCSWLHHYGFVEIKDENNKPKKRYIPFIGAPAPNDIADVVLGNQPDDKFKHRRTIIARLVPCIVDGQPIPRDLVESVVRRASNRVGIKNPKDKRENEWNKTLSIACALFKKSKQGKENFDMALDPNRKTRDYLYGRLLALADSLEEWALSEAKENRSTNAARLMQRFSERPYSTWRTIELALTPYKARLGGKSKKRQRMIDEVIASFNGNDFTNDKRLSGEFLLGYHCQREFLRPGSAEDSDGDDKIAEATSHTNSQGELK